MVSSFLERAGLSFMVIKYWFLYFVTLASSSLLLGPNSPSICLAQELVSASSLPSGVGIASNFDDDEAISSHPSVIFADNFENGELGGKWDEANNKDRLPLSLVDRSRDDAPIGKRSLQVTATLDKNNGGGLTKWFPSNDRLFIRFYTKFAADCDYVHHFCTLRANKSLEGGDRWSGFGGAGQLPDGNERFSTAVEPWGNWRQFPPPGQWNFYSYWHQMKPSPDNKYWGNSFLPPDQPNIEKDQWTCVEFMILHNTPGKPDGEQAFWIDGELRGHWQGFNWRTNPQLMANALTLESYVTNRWTKQNVNTVFFDNVVIAKEYIGPAR
jgi:hypothetical protein